ncbi:hypothetical protein B0H13DRAFT_2428730 [Mycena leptocephala]|nr:hypothetical protein B0H13DRAFT_2428730 [Mycena leptocephala]
MHGDTVEVETRDVRRDPAPSASFLLHPGPRHGASLKRGALNGILEAYSTPNLFSSHRSPSTRLPLPPDPHPHTHGPSRRPPPSIITRVLVPQTTSRTIGAYQHDPHDVYNVPRAAHVAHGYQSAAMSCDVRRKSGKSGPTPYPHFGSNNHRRFEPAMLATYALRVGVGVS